MHICKSHMEQESHEANAKVQSCSKLLHQVSRGLHEKQQHDVLVRAMQTHGLQNHFSCKHMLPARTCTNENAKCSDDVH